MKIQHDLRRQLALTEADQLARIAEDGRISHEAV
jgi:hypothetical protein